MRLAFPAGAAALALALGLGALSVYWSHSTLSRDGQVALAYAESRMVWASPPIVRRSDTVALKDLAELVRRTTPESQAQSLNVPQLLHMFGRGHLVSLVVLRGTYNSLPPDEGVPVHGDVMEIVDNSTHRVVSLTP